VGLVVGVDDLGAKRVCNSVEARIVMVTFETTPTPAQLTTPPSGARVSFVQSTVFSTARSIWSTFVMSVCMYLMWGLVSRSAGGGERSMMDM